MVLQEVSNIRVRDENGNESQDHHRRPRRFLTLGDGDFTFSLDVKHFFDEQQTQAQTRDEKGDVSEPHREVRGEHYGADVHITATSFDSLHDLKQKYKDISFTLQHILSKDGDSGKNRNMDDRRSLLDGEDINKNTFVSNVHECIKGRHKRKLSATRLSPLPKNLEVCVHHNVNAITSWSVNGINSSQLDDEQIKVLANGGFDDVIFNHPHLGTERADLHRLFLNHFFHSCNMHWLKSDGGRVHITLAEGQCERWDAIQGAESHGFVLLHKAPFQTPKVCTHPSYFVARRHQCGKSFAARTTGSKTLTFGRKVSLNHGILVASLPWDCAPFSKDKICGSSKCNKEILPNTSDIGNFKCDFCPKIFKEERSKRNHMKNVHGGAGVMNGDSGMKSAVFLCDICIQANNNGATNHLSEKNSDNGAPATSSLLLRRFNSLEALKDHIKAKHSLLKKNSLSLTNSAWIKSDGFNTANTNGSSESTPHHAILSTHNDNSSNLGQCEICGVCYHAGFGSVQHEAQFRPTAALEQRSFSCSTCAKSFRDSRALLQHENFCLSSEEVPTGELGI